MVGAVWAQPGQTGTDKKRDQQDLDQVKSLVSQVLRRFGRALDVGYIHRNLYVQDRRARRWTMEQSDVLEIFEKSDLSKISMRDLERVFLAEETLEWLVWSQFYREDENEHFAGGSPKKFFSTMRARIWPRLSKAQRKLFHRFYSYDNDDDPPASPKLKLSEIADWIVVNEAIRQAWKAIFPKKLRKNCINASDIKVYSEPLRPDQSDIYPFGRYFSAVAEIKGIWGRYKLTIVKERGKMKILTFTIHDGPG
jgi:hypothetical protein